MGEKYLGSLESYIQSEGRQKICQRQLHLGNNSCQYTWERRGKPQGGPLVLWRNRKRDVPSRTSLTWIDLSAEPDAASDI